MPRNAVHATPGRRRVIELLNLAIGLMAGMAAVLGLRGRIARIHERKDVEKEATEYFGRKLTEDELRAVMDTVEMLKAEIEAAQKAQRRVGLALAFLPAGERDRYRREWSAEMFGLGKREAATFAMQILINAPKVSLLLVLRKAFGREAA